MCSSDLFEVGLTFNAIPARLFIPFSAITGFVYPAVNFALQFQVADDGEGVATHEAAGNDAPFEPIDDGSNVVAVDFKRKK